MHYFAITALLVFLSATKLAASASLRAILEDYTDEITVQLYDIKQLYISIKNFNETNVILSFVTSRSDVVKIIPENVELKPGNHTYEISLDAIGAGHAELHSVCSQCNETLNKMFVIVTVYKDKAVDLLSIIVGWIYFVSLAVSFYPQILVNYTRKSVVGLNFDFLALNIVGFSLYSTFNLGLYFSPEIEAEYFSRFPKGVNPVKPNDIFSSMHGALATLVTIVQCFLYDTGSQTVSAAGKAILAVFAILICIVLVLSSINSMQWLDFLFVCSYLKLTTTLIKYVPQAYMNYKRKSTKGWSIVSSILDFIGGLFSCVQMFLHAYNYDDWISMFGDATKLGLGLFSIGFDIIFITQRFILYPEKKQQNNDQD